MKSMGAGHKPSEVATPVAEGFAATDYSSQLAERSCFRRSRRPLKRMTSLVSSSQNELHLYMQVTDPLEVTTPMRPARLDTLQVANRLWDRSLICTCVVSALPSSTSDAGEPRRQEH